MDAGHCRALPSIQLGAMNYFSDPQETVSRFSAYIEDFYDVFRYNHVDFGSPGDFFAFARTMKFHSELRDDVMRIVKSIMENEANVSFRTILTIMAVASGGPDVVRSDREMSAPVNLIIESLTGDDGIQVNEARPDSSPSQLVANDTIRNFAIDRASSVDEAMGEAPVGQGLFARLASDQISSSGYVGSDVLAESLSRLEQNSLEVKIYLDSIEQRISRMEPRLETIAPLTLAGASYKPSEQARGRVSAAILSESETKPPSNDPPEWNEQSRAMAEPSPEPMRLRKDTEGSYSLRRGVARPVFAGVAIVLVAALVVSSRGRKGDYVMRPVDASVELGASGAGAGLSPGVSSQVSGLADGGGGLTSVATSSGSSGVGPPSERLNQLSKRSAQVAFKASPRSSSGFASKAKVEPATATETSETTPSSDGGHVWDSGLASNRPLDVPSDVMAENLVSGPRPSYPMLASLTRMQGDVVMQAVISKDGSVEHVHVIKGHRLLRGAAKSAVESWRYRPYKINGVPVEVATTVSVEFSLHH